MTRVMKLSRFCQLYPEKVPALRRRLGFHNQTWLRYVNGDRIPRPEQMRDIASGTEFLVTANDFYDIDPERAARALSKFKAAA